MKTIWKYPLNYGGYQNGWVPVDLPKGAKVLYGGISPTPIPSPYEARFCIWALVDISETRRMNVLVSVIGTNQNVNAEHGEYLNTAIDGEFVWHFFVKRS